VIELFILIKLGENEDIGGHLVMYMLVVRLVHV
jgi:hypothetical protein